MRTRSILKLIITCLLFTAFSATGYAQTQKVITGDEQTSRYFPLLKNKKIALFSNHTGIAGNKHILDLLVENNFNVVAIFSPEHGFRGTADAGKHISDSSDPQTGIPILSLYDGKNRTPKKESIQTFDILVVDIQDVGLRFYTYYITMCKLMDACAKENKKMIILDRPNPNGHYVDGPILDMKYKSNVGWLPIPIVHGMTLGELALMINGEKWLPESRQCDITVIECRNYSHRTLYELPVPPSPNLPNMKAIYLYPSLCYFEGTPVSLGRGTDLPFQIYGHPEMKGYDYTFTPQSIPGAQNPPLLHKRCYGVNLSLLDNREILQRGIDLRYVIDAYRRLNLKSKFFRPFFDLLTGRDYIRKMIEAGKEADEIKQMWKQDVENFKKQRKPYLLYEDNL